MTERIAVAKLEPFRSKRGKRGIRRPWLRGKNERRSLMVYTPRLRNVEDCSQIDCMRHTVASNNGRRIAETYWRVIEPAFKGA